MTAYNDFSDLDVTSEDAIRARMEATDEELDSIPISNAVAIVCDCLDIDPLEFLKEAVEGRLRWGEGTPERLAMDLIESSQSNYIKSLHALLEVLTLDQMIADLGMTPADDSPVAPESGG